MRKLNKIIELVKEISQRNFKVSAKVKKEGLDDRRHTVIDITTPYIRNQSIKAFKKRSYVKYEK